MGLTIVLEKENGQKLETIEDPQNVLHRILPRIDDKKYQLVRFVDWYGDTIFNRVQMTPLLDDLQVLLANSNDGEAHLLKSIQKICEQCRDKVHLYIKFYGD